MDEPIRLIKKYPNRRLYDTKTSIYITLCEVKEFVLSGERFKVQDAKTGDDLTRSILLQIIIEEESTGVAPLFTSELLSQLIRFYGHAMQGVLGKYLEENIKSFSDFQKKLQEQSHLLYGEDNGQVQSDMWTQFMNFHGPAMQTMMATYMDQSKKMVHQMQDQLKNQSLSMFSASPMPVLSAQETRITPTTDK
ncbi:MAG: polyhydroxyalkanoate synthesis repressor PhaR [Betaproteobacteria bacterium]